MNKPLHKYSVYFRDKNIFKDNTCFSDIEKKIIKLKATPGRTLRQTKGDAFEVFAEALLATALGLLAAIPAVAAYNKFSNDLEKLSNNLEYFSIEFSNVLLRQVEEN